MALNVSFISLLLASAPRLAQVPSPESNSPRVERIPHHATERVGAVGQRQMAVFGGQINTIHGSLHSKTASSKYNCSRIHFKFSFSDTAGHFAPSSALQVREISWATIQRRKHRSLCMFDWKLLRATARTQESKRAHVQGEATCGDELFITLLLQVVRTAWTRDGAKRRSLQDPPFNHSMTTASGSFRTGRGRCRGRRCPWP